MTYATSHTYKVEILTTGARCLLIAMMCFGKLDFVSVQGVEDFSKMVAMPMNMIEIRRIFRTVATELRDLLATVAAKGSKGS